MRIEVLKEDKNELKLKVHGEDHTLMNMLRGKLAEKVDFVAYRKEHPLDDFVVFLVRTKRGSPRTVIKRAIKELIKEWEALKL